MQESWQAHQEALGTAKERVIGYSCLAAELIVLRAVSSGDVVFGNDDHGLGIARALADHFRFAFSKDDAVKERLHNLVNIRVLRGKGQ